MDHEPRIDVFHASPRWRRKLEDADALVTRAATLAVRRATPARPGEVEVSVALADDQTMRALNGRYRGRDAPTNVLAFPASADGGAGPELIGAEPCPTPVGDVVLGFETVVAEATAAGVPLRDHVTHLIVHGVLHLFGYDHESEPDAARMEAMEVAILAGLGIADPYAEPDARLMSAG